MTIVVTGATGFVGTRLVRLLAARGHHVVALVRTPEAATGLPCRPVIGDVTDPAALATALTGADAVLHLAATTGKADAATHRRVNLGGTQAVVAACRQAGVPRLLFVSSIAAGFADRTGYPYAQAKLEAEDAVRTSGLRTLIVRPTAIFGPGSPVQRGLRGLATLPLMPIIGPGTTLLQPVAVDDVARAIADAVDDDRFDGETIDLGGPEALPVADLLRRLRVAAGQRPGPAVRLPAWAIIGPLRVAERLGLGGVLPVSSGQFASFVQSGAARPHAWTAARQATLTPLDDLLDVASPPPSPSAPAPVDPPEVLAAECDVFTRHLLGVPAAPLVTAAYVRAHTVSPRFAATTGFDTRLVGIARRHPALARMTDAYARLLAPTGLLRRKLILLLALLETTPPHYHAIDAPLASGRVATVVALAWHGVTSLAMAVAGIVVLLPLHLWSKGERA